jgi:hypothetical protein
MSEDSDSSDDFDSKDEVKRIDRSWQQIDDAGVQLLCSEPLSHITEFRLSKTIEN